MYIEVIYNDKKKEKEKSGVSIREMCKNAGVYIPQDYPDARVIVSESPKFILYIGEDGQVESFYRETWTNHRFYLADSDDTISLEFSND